jgi:solute carrier family 25 (mitochondrial dicarboxylate transporter), member 10
MLVCSSIAGALGGAFGNPGDVVNVRMQNDGQLPAAQRRNYRNALDGVIRVTREEGVTSLMRGVGPNVNRAILMTGSQLVSYDVFKDLLLNRAGLSDGMAVHFGSSLLAVSFPDDCHFVWGPKAFFIFHPHILLNLCTRIRVWLLRLYAHLLM